MKPYDTKLSDGISVDLYGFLTVDVARGLRRLIEENAVRTVLEIGTFTGLSTLLFAIYCDRVTTVDTFGGGRDRYLNDCEPVMKRIADQPRIFHANMEAFGMKGKVEPVEMGSIEALARFATEGRHFDMVYIDGSHDYDDVRTDITLALMVADKVICGDDFTDRWPGVVKAVNDTLPDANTEGRLWFKKI